jgi:hypothetical protein
MAQPLDEIQLKRRGFKVRADDVAGSICWALPIRATARSLSFPQRFVITPLKSGLEVNVAST